MRDASSKGIFALLFSIALALWLALLAPFAVVTLGAFLNTSFLGISTEQWAGSGAPSIFGARWFGYIWHLYRHTLGFSMQLACCAVLLCLAIGAPGGYVLARHRFRGCDVIESLVMLPLSLPGVAISIALIQAFAIVRGSWWLILAGHLLYTLPFMVRVVADALRNSGVARLEAAARTLGANFPHRLRWVVLPHLRRSLVVGSLLVFSISWGEFNVSFLLNTPLHQTYPAALYAAYTSNSFPVSSAATVIFLGVILPALVAIQWLGGKETAKAGQGV